MKTGALAGEELRRWIPPDGLERCRPRQVRLTAAGKVVTSLAWSLLAGGIVGGVLLARLTNRLADEARLLRQESVVTEGLVTGRWRGGEGNRQTWISYSFSVGGRAYGRSSRIPSQSWRRLQPGSRIAVHYVPSKPDLNFPLDSPDQPMSLLVPYVLGFGLAACSLLLMLTVRRQSWLLAEGRAAPGLVTRHSKNKGGWKGQQGVLYYDFRLLNGAIASGKGTAARKPPAVGNRITVLYDPERPRRSAIYPLTLAGLARRRPLRYDARMG